MNAVGDRVAIGSPYNSGVTNNTPGSGLVRVYKLNSSSWVQLGDDIFGEDSSSNGDKFGTSVSMNANGDRVAISGIYNNGVSGNYSSSGSVRVYRLNTSNTWEPFGGDIDGNAGDQSGTSVSINAVGDRIAIGARYRDGVNGVDSGSVRVYELNTTDTWVQLGGDIDGEAAYDSSGRSVSMNAVGDRIAIGAYGNDNANGMNSGSVRVYKLNNSDVWEKFGNDIYGESASDFSGHSISMNNVGDRVAIGAINDLEFSGSVRVYNERRRLLYGNRFINFEN